MSALDGMPAYAQAVLEMFGSATWAECAIVLAEHPDALSDEAVEYVESTLESNRANPHLEVIEEVHDFILDCRRRGAEAALAERLRRSDVQVLEVRYQHVVAADDVDGRVRISRAALLLLQDRDDRTERLAWLQRVVTSLLAKGFDDEDRIELLIATLEELVMVALAEGQSETWAWAKHNLAVAILCTTEDDSPRSVQAAIGHFRDSLRVYTRTRFPQDWAEAHYNLGKAYEHLVSGDPDEKCERLIEHLELALEELDRANQEALRAEAHRELARAYSDRVAGERPANIERAIDHAMRALDVHTRADFPNLWASLQSDLGYAFEARILGERTHNIAQAIFHHEQALEVFTREDDSLNWAVAHHNLGVAYQARQIGWPAANIELAVEHYLAALEVEQEHPQISSWVRTKQNLANCYRDLATHREDERDSLLEAAIELYETVLETITEEGSSRFWADVQNNLGMAYAGRRREGDNKRAIDCYERALRVFRKRDDPLKWAMVQRNLAVRWEEAPEESSDKKIRNAAKFYRHALSVYTKDVFPAEYRRTKWSLADMYFKVGRWEEALEAYEAAIAAGADLADQAFTERGRQAEIAASARYYVDAAYCAVRLHRHCEALAILEQGKAQLLADALSLAEAETAGLSPTHLEALGEARARVAELEAQIRGSQGAESEPEIVKLGDELRGARKNLRVVIAAIRSEHPDFLPDGAAVPEILRVVPDGGALVAPLVTSAGGAALVLPAGAETVESKHVVDLPQLDQAKLADLLFGPGGEAGWVQWRTFAASEDDAQTAGWADVIERVAEFLWEWLLAPLHERLQEFGLEEAAPLLLIPQGGLGILPLHAAWRWVDGAQRALLDDYTISHLPSAFVAQASQRRLRARRTGVRSLLAAIDPTEDLPFARLEGVAVATHFPRELRHVHPGPAANRDQVLRSSVGARYLHFACHAEYDWSDAMQSHVLLAGETPLTLADVISHLDLSASRLVTLSACETGFAEVRQSADEYIGLPMAFMWAGAPAVVSTLWAVEDLSTIEFVARFLDEHFSRGLEPAAALRAAQRWARAPRASELAALWQSVHMAASRDETVASSDVEVAFETTRYYLSRPPDEVVERSHDQWAAFTHTGL